MYQPDTDEQCKDLVRDFLEILHDGSMEGMGIGGEEEEDHIGEPSQDLRDFVYQAIKAFAEQNQKAYRESNLVELMNKVVAGRRGDIFDASDLGDGTEMMGSSQYSGNSKSMLGGASQSQLNEQYKYE